MDDDGIEPNLVFVAQTLGQLSGRLRANVRIQNPVKLQVGQNRSIGTHRHPGDMIELPMNGTIEGAHSPGRGQLVILVLPSLVAEIPMTVAGKDRVLASP